MMIKTKPPITAPQGTRLNLDPETAEKLRQLSRETDQSISNLARMFIDFALEWIVLVPQTTYKIEFKNVEGAKEWLKTKTSEMQRQTK